MRYLMVIEKDKWSTSVRIAEVDKSLVDKLTDMYPMCEWIDISDFVGPFGLIDQETFCMIYGSAVTRGAGRAAKFLKNDRAWRMPFGRLSDWIDCWDGGTWDV